jgi:hypothetical protein
VHSHNEAGAGCKDGSFPSAFKLDLFHELKCSNSRHGRNLEGEMFYRLALKLFVVLLIPAGSATVRADLQFPEPVANAGVVYSGTPLVHEFTFENRGPETVVLIEARASCGCLKPRFAQRECRPGQKGALTLEVNTLSQAPGPHTWTVTLKYQSGAVAKEIALQLTARLIAEVTVQPAVLIVFADKIAQHELCLIDSRARPLEVLEVRASSAKLFPHVGEPTHDTRGIRRKIKLTVADDYPDGRHEEAVDIYTNDPRYPDIRVPVTLLKHAQQRLTATPSEVELTAAVGQPFPSRMVLIRDERGQSVHIDQILADDPAITCQWAPGPDVMATLRVRANRSLVAGESLRSAIHIRIDRPVVETVTIPITCTIR